MAARLGVVAARAQDGTSTPFPANIRVMRAALLVASLVLSLPSQARDPDPVSLVGGRLPEAGRGEWASWTLAAEWLIDEGSPEAAARYRWVVWTRPGRSIVFLGSGEKVADAVRVELPRGWEIGFACAPTRSARPDPEIVALVTDPPMQPGQRCSFSEARKAWRLDRSGGRIVSIAPAGVSCQRSCPWD
jgi:hypothetical protein